MTTVPTLLPLTCSNNGSIAAVCAESCSHPVLLRQALLATCTAAVCTCNINSTSCTRCKPCHRPQQRAKRHLLVRNRQPGCGGCGIKPSHVCLSNDGCSCSCKCNRWPGNSGAAASIPAAGTLVLASAASTTAGRDDCAASTLLPAVAAALQLCCKLHRVAHTSSCCFICLYGQTGFSAAYCPARSLGGVLSSSLLLLLMPGWARRHQQ